MTRLFLIAGVAALAITTPAGAKPPQDRGGGGRAAVQVRSGGGQAQARASARIDRAPRMSGRRFERAPRMSAQRFDRPQRFASFQARERPVERARTVERRQLRMNRARVENRMVQRQQLRANRTAEIRNRNELRANRIAQIRNRNELRADLRANRIAQVRNRNELRADLRANRIDQFRSREALRADLRANRIAQIRERDALRNELRANRVERLENGLMVRDARLGRRALRAEEFRVNGYGVGGCPPGLLAKGCMPPGQAAKLLGTPISEAARIAALSSIPLSARYLYPDTRDYFYRYGDGYLYRVDRDTSLVDALLPLAFGGYMPGSYFPSAYMSNAFVPNYYGFNSFYPDSPLNCNRYVNGVVYQVDCVTGFVEGAIPLYASGYGVGQMLPSGYGYYNVPYQYRSLYYDTSDAAYWYAPGAIYRYDPGSSLITSVAALMSPGFTIGQPLPMGYDVYNVPYAYRSTYFDSPSAYYRYNNGYIYQVDPTTMLVTAIVASILT